MKAQHAAQGRKCPPRASRLVENPRHPPGRPERRTLPRVKSFDPMVGRSTPCWAFQTHLGHSNLRWVFRTQARRFQPTSSRSASCKVIRPLVTSFDPTLGLPASRRAFRPCLGSFGLHFVHVGHPMPEHGSRLRGGEGDVACTNPTVLEFVSVSVWRQVSWSSPFWGKRMCDG